MKYRAHRLCAAFKSKKIDQYADKGMLVDNLLDWDEKYIGNNGYVRFYFSGNEIDSIKIEDGKITELTEMTQ